MIDKDERITQLERDLAAAQFAARSHFEAREAVEKALEGRQATIGRLDMKIAQLTLSQQTHPDIELDFLMVRKYLDDQGIPLADENGTLLSLLGRVKNLVSRMMG